MLRPVYPLLVVAIAVVSLAALPHSGAQHSFAQRRLAQADEAGREGKEAGGELECKWLDVLPRDLSSQEDAALDRYGGRQDSTDGGLDLHGLQFRVPSPPARGRRVLTTSVRVLMPSVLKIKCASEDPGVACDVTVTSKGQGATSGADRLLHVEAKDEGTVLIPLVRPARGGAGQRYEIRLAFTVPDGTVASACLGFEFMLQMRPASSVNDELRCPPTLPAAVLPPRKITIGDGDLHFASDELLITQGELMQHSSSDGAFVYPISIRVRGGAAIITAQVSFDWILGDFNMELARIEDDDLAGSSGHVLVRSNQTEAEDKDAQFERSAKVSANVPAGRYRLTLRDKTTTQLQAGVRSGSSKRQDGDEDEEPGLGMCVRFAFSLDGELTRPRASIARLSEHKETSAQAGADKAAGDEQAAGEDGAGASSQASSRDNAKALLLSVEPATAHNLNPAQPLKLLLSFSGPLARFGKDEDGTPDAGRGGPSGAKEVLCSAGAATSWSRSALCSAVFFLRPLSLGQQRGPLGSGGSLTPDSIRFRERPAGAASPNAALLELTWRAGALVDGVEYVLRIEQDYLRAENGGWVSVAGHNGRVHVFRAAACNCHGHGRCDVEQRCACAVGYAGEDCQRCSEGHRLSDKGMCEAVKAMMQCSRTSCNGHGSVSAQEIARVRYRWPLPLRVFGFI